jgi:hypothetical protein
LKIHGFHSNLKTMQIQKFIKIPLLKKFWQISQKDLTL